MKRFEAEDEPYKVELVGTAEGDISLYTQGDFTDLCRGPHLQNAKPIKAFKLTGLAGAYWRGDEKNKQLTRIYGTAFYSQADLDAYLERLEEARKRDHRRLGTQLDLFHLDEVSPGSPFWHPKGMVIWNTLEDLRRRENAKRGYVEVKTPVIFEKSLWETSGHWEKFRENMFLIPDGERHLRPEADELPRPHAASSATGSAATASCRSGSPRRAPLHRNELAGTLHGLTRVRHVTQDDSHLFCTREQIEDEVFGCLDFTAYLYELFDLDYKLRALDPARQQARHRRGVGLHRGRAARGARAARARVRAERGRRRVLRAEDRPAHDRLARPLVADGHRPARLADAAAVRAHLRRAPTTASTPRTSSTARASARSSGSSGS